MTNNRHRLHYVDLAPPTQDAQSTRAERFTRADLAIMAIAVVGLLACALDVIFWRS